MIARVKPEISGVSARSESFLRASWRDSPIRIHVVDQLRDRAVEAEARFHAHREQVECVGKLCADLVAALAGAQADDEVGGEETDPAQHDAEDENPGPAREGAAQEHAEDEAADSDRRFGGQETGRRDRAEPGGEQPASDAVHGCLGVDSEDEPRQAVSGRPDDTVVEWLLALAERGSHLAVVRGSLDRALALASGGRGGLADQIRGSGEEEDGEED